MPANITEKDVVEWVRERGADVTMFTVFTYKKLDGTVGVTFLLARDHVRTGGFASYAEARARLDELSRPDNQIKHLREQAQELLDAAAKLEEARPVGVVA